MSEKNSAPMTDLVMIVSLTSAIIFSIWFVGREAILWVSFLASFYMMKAYLYLPWLMTDSEYRTLYAAYQAIPKLNPTNYGIGSLMQLFEYHGYVWRWVIIPFLLRSGWKTRKGVVRYRYKREIKDVYALIELQAKHFPASAIVRGKNLLDTHPYVGPWATFSLPLDFALDHLILWASKSVVSADDKVDVRRMLPLAKFTPDEKLIPFPQKRKKLPDHRYVLFSIEHAERCFTSQLGPLWKGPEHLPPLEKALYSIFIAQGNGDQAASWKMIEQIGFSFIEGERDKSGKLVTPHRANMAGVDDLIAKFGKHPKITEITNRHAHSYNVLVELLTWARQKGRLMHSNIGWIRPVNRTLFFAINSEGGQCPFWESAGLWSHAQVERLMGKKITVPMVAGAICALRELMSREHWIDPGEFSEAAQQRQVREANDILQAEQDRAKQQKNRMPGPPNRNPQRAPAAQKPASGKPVAGDEEP